MASRTKRTRSTTAEINPIAPAGAWNPNDPAHGVAAAAVVSMVLRVAGPVPTRVDLRNAGTPERQLGISLGAVLVFLRSHYTARTIEQAWSQAAPLAVSLPPVLVGRRRGVLAQDGPWSATAIVRLGGAPKVRAYVMEARAGSEAPAVLRIEVGPMTWEIYDAASYTSLLQGWRTAVHTLRVEEPEVG